MKNYKGVIFEGSTFPHSPYKIVSVKLNSTIVNEYLPALHTALPTATKGLQYLLTAMTHQEGFKSGTRSYKYRNPGNIGNTDQGKNVPYPTLEDGIKAQANYIEQVAAGNKKAYPLGNELFLKPSFSQEIHDNQKTYGLGDGNIPGYKFTYIGQLDQFVKIYSTGARLSNNYLNVIVSYFAQNGLTITPESTLQDIINMN